MQRKLLRKTGALVMTAALTVTAVMPSSFAASASVPANIAAVTSAVGAAAVQVAGHFTIKDEIPKGSFSKNVIDLTLEKAVEYAQTEGTSGLAAETSKKSDEAAAATYRQTLSSITDYLDADIFAVGGYTLNDQKMYKLMRDFAYEHIETNYQADMNSIESNVIEAYYGVIQARDSLAINQETLALAQEQLRIAQKKYELGTISKISLTQTENETRSAETAVETAQTVYDSARRGLNLLTGFDVMQSIDAVSPVTMATMPAIDVDDAVEKAKTNRNEVVGINYALQLQELMMNSMKNRYPSSSAKYKEQYAKYISAQMAAESVPLQIETDIRTKANAVLDKADAVKSAQSALQLAESAYVIAQATYKAGSSIAADVKSAELTVHKAELGVTAAVAAFNTAVFEYETAQGIGTERISF